MNERIIILNQIQCPDGTILTSHFRHDFQIHLDKNGLEYSIDGGRAYLRRSSPEIPYVEKTVYSDEPFYVIRQSLYWGTYGKSKLNELSWIKLCDMSDEHIKNVIVFVKSVHPVLKKFFVMELKWRNVYKVFDK